MDLEEDGRNGSALGAGPSLRVDLEGLAMDWGRIALKKKNCAGESTAYTTYSNLQ